MICWCVKFGKQTFLTHIRSMVDDRLVPLQQLLVVNSYKHFTSVFQAFPNIISAKYAMFGNV